ncbi:hypothetical protein KAFR_0C01070 [Kazachstania africana CBS 2517]|uniref:3'(2'),5'-bisphosphate nucleotidase n=1 Tax=Kazachstania africana (strain ATCC 22294 / BCRC 22015 / CBS 2517 / CECT 1963 / NBRC 1671 / NRRL Y-8276) TaxID=1071382 RepID=H2ARV2_KAZAF|nr:hypothetical protein KAFR_0C01070 [Kazachstania africana CBS 2517]CCF57102.1 hypothetical protein KAFR_0C01070 [Kazachstania africana CBS 2517]
MQFEKELLVATEAVRKASYLTKTIQKEVISHTEDTITKSDESPVTIGDYAAQTIIINAIKANFPNDHIVGEESADGLSDEFLSKILTEINNMTEVYKDSTIDFVNETYPLRTVDDVRQIINYGNYEGGRKGRFWCLDPIDGTKGFLRGQQFAVCLGLIVDGVTQVGCIGCPNLKLDDFGYAGLPRSQDFGYLFRAVRGSGSFYNTCSLQAKNDWTQIRVRHLKNTEEMISLEGVEKTHSSHDEQSQIKHKLGITKTVNLDSQVKYCLLALGVADIYLRLPIKLSFEEKIWDHAAGNVIVHEAGGFHTDSIQNLPLDFGNGRVLATKGVIASSGPKELHDLVVTTSSGIIKSRSDFSL